MEHADVDHRLEVIAVTTGFCKPVSRTQLGGARFVAGYFRV